MIKPNSDSDQSPELGVEPDAFQKKVKERQLALERYQYLLNVPEENLTIDDKLFIKNFEAVMYLCWKVKFFNF